LRGADIIPLFSDIIIGNIFDILAQTGWVARGVLGLLLFASLISWALIFQKSGLFGRTRRQSDQFLKIFRATKGVANPQGLMSAGSPFANVYAAGYRELQSQLSGTGNPSPPKLKSLQAVTVSMQLAAADEVRRVEKGMSWLATTAGVGTSGAASLRAVAPGIAEALVTTAAGLFAAIPALIAYNYFLQDIRDLAQRLDSFALEFTSQIEKTFT